MNETILGGSPPLFPFGPGFEQIDANVLANMSDADLTRVCKVNNYLAGIGRHNEFWRLRLSKDLNLTLILTGIVDYKDLYIKYSKCFGCPNEIASVAVENGNLEIFEHILPLLVITENYLEFIVSRCDAKIQNLLAPS
jgi:hypothetical protein